MYPVIETAMVATFMSFSVKSATADGMKFSSDEAAWLDRRTAPVRAC
jgi:hypothetical protein